MQHLLHEKARDFFFLYLPGSPSWKHLHSSVTEFEIAAIPRFMNLSGKAYLGRLVVSIALLFSFGVAWIIAQWFEWRDSFCTAA